MRSLVFDWNEVIEKAKKDSCLVVGDCEDYIAEAYRQLN